MPFGHKTGFTIVRQNIIIIYFNINQTIHALLIIGRAWIRACVKGKINKNINTSSSREKKSN